MSSCSPQEELCGYLQPPKSVGVPGSSSGDILEKETLMEEKNLTQEEAIKQEEAVHQKVAVIPEEPIIGGQPRDGGGATLLHPL